MLKSSISFGGLFGLRLVRWGLPLLLLFVSFQNCGGPSDQSAFGSKDVGPAEPLATDIYFLRPGPANSLIEKDQDIIAIGGECDVGDLANHYIEFQMFAIEGNPKFAANQNVRVRDDASCRVATPGSQCFKFTQSRCEHGMFYAHIPVVTEVASDAYGIPYTLTAQLVSIDANGVEHRDLVPSQSVRVEILGP